MNTFLERVREANRPPAVEHSVALRVAVFIAVVVATFAALDLGVGGVAGRVICLVGLPGGYVLSYALRDRNRGWLKALLAVAALGAFAQFLGLMGPALAGQVFGLQAGLVGLFLWVQVLHSMDLPARRDLMFSLATSGALLIATAALATTNTFGVALVLWLGAAMCALAIANLNDLALVARRARTLRRIPIAVLVVVGIAVFLLQVLPAARVFSFGLPSRAAAGGIETGGRLMNPALNTLPSAAGGARGRFGRFGYFGYSDTLNTAFRGRPDNTLVMRVRSAAPDFWRAQSFDSFDGQVWRNSDTRLRRLPGEGPFTLGTPEEDSPTLLGEDLIQTFYIEKMAPNVLFAAASPKRLFWPFEEAYQLSDGTVRAGDTMAPGTVYSVISRRLPVTPAMLRAHGAAYGSVSESVMQRYTQLPEVPARVRELAESIAAVSPNAYDAIQAMTAWIGAHTVYSLNPPDLNNGEDAVEQFLFEDKRGFCEQIASSLVVMLRSIGVPARLTVGYTPGRRNPFTGLWEVRASNAHAYAEVLFPGVGWQAFDPTASVPLAGDTSAFPTRAGAGLVDWVGAALPDPRDVVLPAVATATVAVAATVVVVVRRRRQRTWLDIQLRRLSRTTGIALDSAVTLPQWLDRLEPDARPRYQPIVAALEREAFGAPGLADAERTEVEDALAVYASQR